MEKLADTLPPDPGPAPERGTPEYMTWMNARKAFLGKVGGRPRKNAPRERAPTRAEKREIVAKGMKELEPEAVLVLQRQLASDDERVAANAAKLILEWSRGKPTQSVKTESNVVTEIRYESAAWRAPIHSNN